MENLLPKQLRINLEVLFTECMLNSWTINSNENLSTVVIRFKNSSTDDYGAKPKDSATFIKYKRVPPSQLERDMNRANVWKVKQMVRSGADDEPTTTSICTDTTDIHV